MTDIYMAMFILFCVIVGAIWVFTRDYKWTIVLPKVWYGLFCFVFL